MLEIRGFGTKINVDVGRMTKTLNENMSIQMRQAARAWLREVITHVPVWTGTSKGSLQPIGRFLNVQIPISPRVTRKGMGPDVGAKASAFKFYREKSKHFFKIDINVAHYAVNEYHNVNLTGQFHLTTPGPYHSFEYGEMAFEDYVRNTMPGRLPRLETFIMKTKYKLS